VNDLRRIILWLATLGFLAIGVWGFNLDEVSGARPFAPENRAYRSQNQIRIFGRVYHLPVGRMLCGWGAILCAGAGLWPLATSERSSRWLGRWERRSGPKPNCP